MSLFFGLLLSNIMLNGSYKVLATELYPNEQNRKNIDVNIEKLKSDLTEGMLDIPERIQRKVVLYEWIMEAVEQYMEEAGIEDVFYCDLENDVLYGDREFILIEAQKAEWERFVYPIKNEKGINMRQERYQLMLKGTEHILYMDVNVNDGIVHIYPKESCVAMQVDFGNSVVYELIERDENGKIIYYPNGYVESDWNDLLLADNHFAEISLDELKELSFIKVPENATEWNPWCYLNVASVLKRYIEENQIEDVFYFDVDRDVISHVTNMIYTCRLRGNTMTLYIDIDGYNMKAHVYQVED